MLMHVAGEEARRCGAEAEAKYRTEFEQLVSDSDNISNLLYVWQSK